MSSPGDTPRDPSGDHSTPNNADLRPPAWPGPADWSSLGGLFDFGFTRFVTSGVVRVVYVLGLVTIGITALRSIGEAFSLMFSGLASGALIGVLWLLLALVGGVVAALLLRVALELVILAFRISDDLSAIRRRGGV